ncbi:MAG: hypothetical protein IJY58_02825 [Alphaproteobacteria bacterium]|nr:hypothetical protein [Alphaproteobacteria bacterium]
MKRTNESGRSMVEMLGVLAIIGVLSIGGIAGYTMAMNRYRANEVVDAVNKYAVIAYTACQTAKTMRGTTTCAVGTDYPTYDNSGLTSIATLAGGSVVSKIGAEADGSVTFGTQTTAGERDSYTSIDVAFTNADICKAAASTAGTVCTDNKFTYTVRNS